MSKSALDAIRTQVMWNRLIAVVEEQAQSLLRSAFGTITREAGDLSAGVYNAEGHMIAQAMTGTPGHVNTMATAVGHFFKHYPQSTMKPGDVYVTNDPWLGTGHLFDYVMMTPVFLGKKLVAFFASHLPRDRCGRRRHVGQGQFLLRGRHPHSASENAQRRQDQRGTARR